MPKITFLPADVTIEVPAGTSVFAASAKAEIPIPSQCGGKCACALCRVRVVDGEDLVSAIQWDEEGHMGNVYYLTQERLSCQTRVFGDVVIEVEDAPIKEKVRGRYIPYSLIRKREKLEEEEELLRVRKGDRGSGQPRGGGGRRPRRDDREPRKGRQQPATERPERPKEDAELPPPAEAAPKDPTQPTPDQPDVTGTQRASGADDAQPARKRRRRRRRRNPGAPRAGDTRPPPGKPD